MKCLVISLFVGIMNLCVFSQATVADANAKKSVDTAAVKRTNPIASPEKLRPIQVNKLTGSVVIDGKLDEQAWKDASVFKDFLQTYPGDNAPASKPTEVYLAFDEKHLYIAFKCWDEKDKIRATLAKRDAVTGEDNVRVWLDTFNDRRRAYVLAFNPFGIQQDGIFTEGAGTDFSVDIVMESKGVIEDWGWAVEVKIPFKSIRYTSGDGKLWGFNAARNIDRFNDEMDEWMPKDRGVMGTLIQHGQITGLTDIKHERTLEIVPSITVSQSGIKKRTLPISTAQAAGYDPIFFPIGLRDGGRYVNDPANVDLGLNLKYQVTPTMTLDAAINPDFAEIEADSPVVTANQRFPIYFAERRPFFLEGKEIFETRLNSFFSRNIVDPDAAVKLSGKQGKTVYGIMVASDNAPGNYSLDELTDPVISRRIEPFVDKNAFFAVTRFKRDIGREGELGFIATARTFPRDRNFNAGFDGRFKLNRSTTTQFQIMATHSRKNFYDPERDSSRYSTGNGIGYYFNIDKTTDKHGYFIEALGFSNNYRASSGFTSRTNTNTVFFANRISTSSKPDRKIIRANFQQFARYRFDWQGRPQGGFVGASINFAFQGNAYLYSEAGSMFERIYEDEFGPKRDLASGRQGAFFGSPERKAIQPYGSINFDKIVNQQLTFYGFVGMIGNRFDYDFGSGGRYQRASRAFANYLSSDAYNAYIQDLYTYQSDPVNNILPDLPTPPALDPGKGLQFDAEAYVEYKPVQPFRVSLSYSKSWLRRHDTKEMAFNSDIFTIRSTYQFSRFLFTRLRLDYDHMSSNTSGQLLFGWNPNPGTAFYAGYNDNFNYNGFNSYTGHYEPGFERNSRTFFIRASYLFRKSF